MPRVDFKTLCPSCSKSTNRICYWVHAKCDYHQEIDQDGDIYCNKCGWIGKLWDLYYRCKDHADDGYLPVNSDRLQLVLTEIGSLPGAGLIFAKNLLDACIKSGKFTL